MIPGHGQRFIKSCHICIFFLMGMRPYYDDRRFRITRKHRCHSRSRPPQPGESELSVYQQIIENKIDRHSRSSRLHRHYCFPALTHRTGINLQDHKRRKIQ